MEHDSQTLEYYDQPQAITLDYKSANDRCQVVRHTPDFFVLRQDAAGWEEWKTEDELNRLEHSPNRYCSSIGPVHLSHKMATAKLNHKLSAAAILCFKSQ